MQTLTIIKIGGKLLDNEAALSQAISSFSNIKGAKILVHGGGKLASEISLKLGVEPKMHEGRRITDKASLEVATMVYAGLLNKQLVSQLQGLNCNAIGFSGADGNLILSEKRPIQNGIDFGWVGDVKSIHADLLVSLLEKEITPVFCAITHDGKGQLFNTNADTIASVIAASLAPDFEVTLKFCFEKEGVLSDPNDDASVFPTLSKADYEKYKAEGGISDGMIPKIDNAFDAKDAQVHQVFICGINGILEQKGTELCL